MECVRDEIDRSLCMNVYLILQMCLSWMLWNVCVQNVRSVSDCILIYRLTFMSSQESGGVCVEGGLRINGIVRAE